MDVEVVGDDRVSKQHQASNFGEGANPLDFDNGLTCSSAKCFAGHAKLLAGGRNPQFASSSAEEKE